LREPSLSRVLIAALAAVVVVVSAPATVASAAEATFEWTMPARLGAQDAQGRLAVTQPREVRPGPWTVHLRVTGPACAEGAAHRWSADGRDLAVRRLGPCRYAARFRDEGSRLVRLDARVGAESVSGARQVDVEDFLIVSIGDSVASGEAAPDVPDPFRAVWQSVPCHRSARSAHALAAERIEDAEPRSSVTFVHLACSGATIGAGLLGSYRGIEPPRDGSAQPPQVDVLREVAAARQVDAVLLSIGANDSHFGDIVVFCAIPARDCFEERLPRELGGDGTRTVREAVRDSLRGLPEGYRRLAAAISAAGPPGAPTPPARVYAVEYFDPTRDARGETCRSILGSVKRHELEHAQAEVLAPLNAMFAAAADDHDWQFVGGVHDLYREHGYCARGQEWVTDLRRSMEGLGGTLRGRFLGTLHPNRKGHEETSKLIAAALEEDLLPSGAAQPEPRPHPVDPNDADEEGGGLDVPDWLTPLLILLGLGLGALVLVDPGGKVSLFLKPFVTLTRSLRPLLLFLFVAAAVATTEYSPVAVVLISAALAVLAWRLILLPERRKSTGEEDPSWGRDFLRAAGACLLAALALVVLLVLAHLLLGIADPYLAAADDPPSALLLIAIVLWALAAALRLVSFATTLLRAAVAVLLALAVYLLLGEAGLVPGIDWLGNDGLARARIAALIALLLLLADASIGLLRGEEQKTPAERRRDVFRWTAIAGLGIASVAAAVLAVSTLWGMLEAAGRGGPLNPPDSEVVNARPIAAGAADAEGDIALARRFAPVLAFAEEERWTPIAVDEYVEEATLSGPPGTRASGWTAATLPNSCPAFGETSCYELTLGCDAGTALSPGAEALCDGREREADRLHRDGAVYVRVLERGRPELEEPRGAFIAHGPYRGRLDVLLQYWFFYPYNEWRTPVFAGELVQRHEADWEAVTIGLDAARRPLFVADSAHCGGSWEPWSEVEASTRLAGPRTHPLVAVARGSHANYQSAEERRAPDWASCAGAPEGVTTAISYASNIRDETELGWLWYPPADGWLPAKARLAPMTFPGTWGADDRTVLKNFKTTVLHEGDAPRTPSLQGLWRDPVRTIFCGRFKPRRCN
jgi:GDSL-like Lipase/Acylhydrolase family